MPSGLETSANHQIDILGNRRVQLLVKGFRCTKKDFLLNWWEHCLMWRAYATGNDQLLLLSLVTRITLHAPNETLEERFLSRWYSGKRHPGHCDHVEGHHLAQTLRSKGPSEPLELPGWHIRVDTSDFRSFDRNALIEFLNPLIKPV